MKNISGKPEDDCLSCGILRDLLRTNRGETTLFMTVYEL